MCMFMICMMGQDEAQETDNRGLILGFATAH